MSSSFYINKNNVDYFKKYCRKLYINIDMEVNDGKDEIYLSVSGDKRNLSKLNKIYSTFNKTRKRKSFFSFLFV